MLLVIGKLGFYCCRFSQTYFFIFLATGVFPESELRYLLIFAWATEEIDKVELSIQKAVLRIILRRLQSNESTKEFVKTADPGILGQTLSKHGFLVNTTKAENHKFKFNKVSMDHFLRNLGTCLIII